MQVRLIQNVFNKKEHIITLIIFGVTMFGVVTPLKEHVNYISV